jgi:Protein of unknown function (DUF1573)
MRRKIIFLIGLFIFQFCVCIPEGRCASPEPAAAAATEQEKVDLENTWDFGTVKQGEILKHEFTLKNRSENILEINSIHTSCGCTASESGKKSILPAGETTIKVTFNSHGYLGTVQQFVYVNTSDPDLAIIKFTIKANVEKKK